MKIEPKDLIPVYGLYRYSMRNHYFDKVYVPPEVSCRYLLLQLYNIATVGTTLVAASGLEKLLE